MYSKDRDEKNVRGIVEAKRKQGEKRETEEGFFYE